MNTLHRLAWLVLGAQYAVTLAAAESAPALTIPTVSQAATKRLVTVNDIAAIRKIAMLSAAPDGRSYAAYVRQPDAKANTYRAAWFVGDMKSGDLRYAGDGGETRFLVLPNGVSAGDLLAPEVHWSADSQWIAYTLKRAGEVQLWRSRADGSSQQQLSRNASDVMEFAWSEDGSQLMYAVGTTRDEKMAQADRRSRSGYRYDEDLQTVWELLSPHPRVPPEKDLTVWVVDLADGRERLANEAEQALYKRARERQRAGSDTIVNALQDVAVPPVPNSRGDLLWLKRLKPRSLNVRLMVSRDPQGKDALECSDERCSGMVNKAWWSADGTRAVFLRYEGEGRLPGYGLYSWSPRSGRVATVARFPHDFLRHPQPVPGGKLLVVRETVMLPPHVAAIDERTGKVTTLADVNPEFRNIHVARAERIEWDAAKLAWNEPGGLLAGAYQSRNGGYILYPPDFDPAKRYPVFLDPYAVVGFSDSVGHEHPIQAYAAAGMVVLNSAFPGTGDILAMFGDDAMRKLYSAELDYPHMTMLTESVVRGLDALAARGFVDTKRVGIGGVSHGTFIPLYMMQKHDRITAISIAAGSWGPQEYYWPTRKGREAMKIISSADWRPKPVGEGREFWRRLDIAEHIDEIEAPIIMHHSLGEAHVALRFMRHLADEGRPYDAYVFANEMHVKWQPAHLHSIMQRNLDWFRFWLQDHEDAAAEKQEQYQRWRALREMQCKNPRSLRNYCSPRHPY